MISNRYSKANCPYVTGYDKDPESNDITVFIRLTALGAY